MGLPRTLWRWHEEWKKQREENARLHKLHASLLESLGERSRAMGGRAFVMPCRVDTVTLALWRQNGKGAAMSAASRDIAAAVVDAQHECGAETVEYALLRPLDGTVILEAHLPWGIVYFRFKEE